MTFDGLEGSTLKNLRIQTQILFAYEQEKSVERNIQNQIRLNYLSMWVVTAIYGQMFNSFDRIGKRKEGY